MIPRKMSLLVFIFNSIEHWTWNVNWQQYVWIFIFDHFTQSTVSHIYDERKTRCQTFYDNDHLMRCNWKLFSTQTKFSCVVVVDIELERSLNSTPTSLRSIDWKIEENEWSVEEAKRRAVKETWKSFLEITNIECVEQHGDFRFDRLLKIVRV